MRTALRHRTYRWAASLYTVDSLLEWFGSIALMVLVYRSTESTTVAAGMLLCKQILPGVLVPLLGPAIDRMRPGQALGLAFATQASALIVAALTGYGPGIFVLAAVSGAAGATTRSLLRAAIARSLDGDALRGGNALVNIAASVSALAGPALAALAVETGGPAAGLLLAGVVLLGTAALATVMPQGHAIAELEEGESTTTSGSATPSLVPVAWLLGLVAAVSCIFSMDDPAMLAYSEESLGAGVAGYGAIFTAWGVGVTAGSLLFTRLMHLPMLRVYAIATVLAGGAYLGMSVSPTITITCCIAVIGGVGNGMDWVAMVTAVQEATPRGQEARVARYLEALSTAGPGVGIVLGGVVADVVSPRATLLIPGVLALALLAGGAAAVRLRQARLDGSDPRPLATTNFSPPIHGGSA